MLANFFSIGDRNYLNNAVVIADALERIIKIFGPVSAFKIQFKKPFLSQGDFQLSLEKLEGYIVGSFRFKETQFYFSYNPTNVELENKIITRDDFRKNPNYVNLCFYITDICRGYIEDAFEKELGSMNEEDKVIFVIFEVPDIRMFSVIVASGDTSHLNVRDVEYLGDRKFRLSIYNGDHFFGYRYSTVKKFNV